MEQTLAGVGEYVDFYTEYILQSLGNKVVYQDMADYKSSVEANGGFYIGRYEAGASSYRKNVNLDATISEIISTNGTPLCVANQIPYFNITHSQAKGLAESMYTGKGFTCTLLTGAAWDRTVGFLMEEGANNKTDSQVYAKSIDWGNYRDANFTVTNTSAKYRDYWPNYSFNPITSYLKETDTDMLFTTGATDRNSAKNIYDLAGNVDEWTLQKYEDKDAVGVRGGNGDGDANAVGDSAGKNGYQPMGSYSGSIGFRPALYL